MLNITDQIVPYLQNNKNLSRIIVNHYFSCSGLKLPSKQTKAIFPKTGLLFGRLSQALGRYQGGFIERDQPILPNRL